MNKWIPISEKTPEKEGWYQCTVSITMTNNYVMDLYFKDGLWLDNRRIDMYNIYEIHGYGHSNKKHIMAKYEFDEFDFTKNVIAWAPLPEPFKVNAEQDILDEPYRKL